MRDYFQQVRDATRAGFSYVGLATALTVPDICAAMDAPDGLATGMGYRDWFDKWVAGSYGGFLTGEDAYLLRCSMLHQGTTKHPRGDFERFLFTERTANHMVLHNNIVNDALNLDVIRFVDDMVDGALSWLATAEPTPTYQRNFPKFVQRYSSGLAPFIVGVPVIS
jgi:hypothetical protein